MKYKAEVEFTLTVRAGDEGDASSTIDRWIDSLPDPDDGEIDNWNVASVLTEEE